MIQDMGNPEIYYEKYVDKDGERRCGGWRDLLEGEVVGGLEGRGVKLGERGVVGLVGLPGLGGWCLGRGGVVEEVEVGKGRKRGREEEEGIVEMEVEGRGSSGRRRRVGSGEGVGKVEEGLLGIGFDGGEVGRRLNVAGSEEVSRGSMAVTGLIYDRNCDVKLHMAVRVIGVVWWTLGNVPRIHVLSLKRLSCVECHPLYEQIALRPAFGGEMRDDVVGCLAGVLKGNMLAAEYCLMGLVSNVALRSSYATLGKVTVSLVLPNSWSPRGLIDVIESLFARSVVVEVSMQSLNAGPLYPRKEADSDIVIASKLQVAPGTVVIIDETKMGEGHLSAVGVKNLQALAELAKRRVVPLQLAYDSTEIETDCAVVILSHTKALTPSDVAVYVPETSKCSNVSLPSEEKLWRLRTAMGMIGEGGLHHGIFNVDQTVSKAIETSFVEERRRGLRNGEEALQRWLSIARALARSHGESDLSVERWNQALGMEKARLETVAGSRKK